MLITYVGTFEDLKIIQSMLHYNNLFLIIISFIERINNVDTYSYRTYTYNGKALQFKHSLKTVLNIQQHIFEDKIIQLSYR